jgi:hypothetical protein
MLHFISIPPEIIDYHIPDLVGHLVGDPLLNNLEAYCVATPSRAALYESGLRGAFRSVTVTQLLDPGRKESQRIFVD